MLGTGIVNIVNMFRPQLILLGGAMSEYAQTMTGPIREMMERDCFGGANGMIPEIAAAELGSNAGMIGAANLSRIMRGDRRPFTVSSFWEDVQ